MRVATHVLLAYLLLVLFGAVFRVLPFEVVAPNVAVVFAVYLGMTAPSGLYAAVLGGLAIGYLADLLTGSPRGLGALVAGLLGMGCRLLASRLLLRGRLFVAVFAFLASLAASLLALGARAYFGAGLGAWHREAIVAIGSAFLTALVAPPIFRLCRLVDARFARTQREREAVREGYLS
jgi:rod shape-determining protein MreD